MYQKIDETQDKTAGPDTPASPNAALKKTRVTAVVLSLIGIAILGAAAFWLFYKPAQNPPHPAAQDEAISAFRRIQAERSLALRRARLVDYTRSYPNSPVSHGAREQLRVVNDYEAKDWAALSDVMFTTDAPITDKRFALGRYIARWGEGLAGSRDADIAAFKSTLSDKKPRGEGLENNEGGGVVELSESPNLPIDRRHVPGKSPISQTIDGRELAGGRPIAATVPTPAPPPPPARVIIPAAPRPEITPARVRRARTPVYPRRAYARRVSASVQLSLNIDERGRVGLVETLNVDAARYGRDFERAARRAAKRTRFHPRTIDGEPAPARDIRKTYIFNPEE